MENTKDDLASYFEILESPVDATWPEIKKSYNSLKELYSNPTLALFAISEEDLDGKENEILTEVEEAYRILENNFKKTRTQSEEDIKQITSKVTFFTGKSLRNIREELGIDLLDISIASNIQINHFKNIEDELYSELPNDIYLRGYLKRYAEYMMLDSNRVVNDYMRCYREWEKTIVSHNKKGSGKMNKLFQGWFGRGHK